MDNNNEYSTDYVRFASVLWEPGMDADDVLYAIADLEDIYPDDEEKAYILRELDDNWDEIILEAFRNKEEDDDPFDDEYYEEYGIDH
jgi:hypothetical protein